MTAPDPLPDPPRVPRPVVYLLAGLVVYLAGGLASEVARSILQSSGFFVSYYGPAAENPDAVLLTRMRLWSMAVGFPLWLGCVGVVLLLPGVRAANLGIHFRGQAKWALGAAGLACVVAPVLVLLNIGVTAFHQHWLAAGGTE